MAKTLHAVKPPRSGTSKHPRTAAEMHALCDAISAPRLSTYLRYTHHNARRALELYVWNIRAGAALLPILQVNEVTLRNAVNRALVAAFDAHWPYSNGFLRSLPKRDRRSFLEARQKLERKLRVSRASTGDVVAAQTYWFWVSMLTRRYDKRIWKRQFASAFPYAPTAVDREVVRDIGERIRKLRNRIAHHEPLMKTDLVGAYKRAVAVVRWISPVKAEWACECWPLNDTFTSPR